MRKLVVVLGLALVLSLIACRAGKPGSLETGLVREVKQNITIGGKDWKNPIPFSQQAAEAGGFHFRHHCQICHGLDGQNTGVPFAEKMDPPVANLTDKDIQEYTDGQLKWIIQNGIGPSGMPGWKGILEEDEMWKIVHYIRHLPPKGSLGAPEIYKEAGEEHAHGAEAGAQKGGEQKPHTHEHERKH